MAKQPPKRDPGRDPEAELTEPQGGFLRRWSQRKASARTRERDERDEREALPELDSSNAPPSTQDSAPAEVPTDADMPPVESLDEHSDYRGFLSPKVSEDLRRLALRKLFHLPMFNIRDGLDDYDEDFRTFEPLGNIVTADMRHRVEMEQRKLKEKLAESEAAADDAVPPTPADAASAEDTASDESADLGNAEEGDDADDLEQT